MPDDRSLLAALFPDRSIVSTSDATPGHSKRTVAVWFEKHDPVVVQYTDETSLRTEGELARAIRARTDVPVPRVFAVGTHGAQSYVVSELAPGENLHSRFVGFDRPHQEEIAADFGRYLAQLHDAFRFEGVGGVVSTPADGETAFRATGGTDRGTWLQEYAARGIEVLPSAFDGLREDLNRAVDALADLPGETVLYPWDFRPGNVLVSAGALSAVVDWSDPLAAPAGLSVAKTEYLVADWYVADADPLEAAFRRGYESVRDLPSVPPIYRLIAVVRSAVDSNGVVTRPRYPEWTGERAVEFHRTRIRNLLAACDPA